MWRKGDPRALVVGMQIDTATMENGYGDSLKKLGIRPWYDPAVPLLGMYPEETKI